MDSAMEGVPSASISSFSHRDNSPAVPFAVAVGVVLRHWEFVHAICLGFGGLSITEVVSASITVIIGTTLNYFLDDRINRAQILFPGVGCFFFPVRLGSAVLSSNIADDEAKLNNLSDDCKYGAKPVYVGSYHWNSRRYFSFKCIYGLLRREGFFSHEWDATHNSAYSGLDQSYLPQGNADEEEDDEHVITEGHNHRDRRRSEDTLYQ